MTIKIIRNTWISGESVKAGEVLQVDEDTGSMLKKLGHAEDSKAVARDQSKPAFTREK